LRSEISIQILRLYKFFLHFIVRRNVLVFRIDLFFLLALRLFNLFLLYLTPVLLLDYSSLVDSLVEPMAVRIDGQPVFILEKSALIVPD
jgi:hypothetical protein